MKRRTFLQSLGVGLATAASPVAMAKVLTGEPVKLYPYQQAMLDAVKYGTGVTKRRDDVSDGLSYHCPYHVYYREAVLNDGWFKFTNP